MNLRMTLTSLEVLLKTMLRGPAALFAVHIMAIYGIEDFRAGHI